MKILQIISFILLFSCQYRDDKRTNTNLFLKDTVSLHRKFTIHDRVLDTLNKYKNCDSLVMSFHTNWQLDDFVYIVTLGKQKFALHSILEDGTLRYYALVNDEWLLQDTLTNVSANNYSGYNKSFNHKDSNWLLTMNYFDRPELALHLTYFVSSRTPQLRLIR